MLTSSTDIDNILFINLEARTDRKEYVQKQLRSIGLIGQRFNAIRLQNGAAGCTMSHIKCLEIARESRWDHVLIVEDDITFTNPTLFLTQLNRFLEIHQHENWDVLLFGGNIIPPHLKEDSASVQVINCQTTTGYLVRQHYYDKLIHNFKEGLKHLLREPEKHKEYAIDRYWFKLQEKDNWFLITPLTVTQRENDFSDIEQKNTNYSRAMLDLEKPWLLPSIRAPLKPPATSKPPLKPQTKAPDSNKIFPLHKMTFN